MKRVTIGLRMVFRLLLLSLLLLAACKSHAPPASPALGVRSAITDAKLIPPLVKGLNRFALELYRNVEREGNALYSPFSIATALSLAELGTAGESAKALHSLLGMPAASEHRLALRGLLLRLKGSGETQLPAEDDSGDIIPPHALDVSSSLWVAKGYPLAKGFAASALAHYGAAADTINVFRPDESAEKVNAWATRTTNSKIKTIATPGDITALTSLLLVNIVYFRGSWWNPFGKDATKDREFYPEGASEPVMVPTMRTEGFFKGMQDDKVSILEMGYSSTDRDADIAMSLIIPKERDGLRELENSITPEQLDRWFERLTRAGNIEVSLPKWRTESRANLGEVLSGMGIAQLFSDEANLSGVSKKKGLRLGQVLHKTHIEVDETGTEASAATMVIGPCGEPPVPTAFKIDHPFLYLIRDTKSGAILFIGRVADPRLGV